MEGEKAMSELRELYKTFLETELKEGDFTESLQSDTDDLKRIFGLGNKEATDLQLVVQKDVYINRLRQLFSTKELDEAQSKAAVLNDLVMKYHRKDCISPFSFVEIGFGFAMVDGLTGHQIAIRAHGSVGYSYQHI